MAELGWGAGGISDALQLVQALQTGKIENAQRQTNLETSQLQLNNQKKLQAQLGSGQFGDLTSQDPDAQSKSMHELAATMLADGMPEQAQKVNEMANQTATTKANVAATQASTALGYVSEAEKVFGGVTNSAQWAAAQQYMQSVLPPDALKNPTIKGLLTTQYDPNKVQILPQFFENMKSRAQAALEKANTVKSEAETRTQSFDQDLKTAQTEYEREHAAYLKRNGGLTSDGTADGDKASRLSFLLARDQVPLPGGSRSQNMRNQIITEAIKNNPDSTAEEINDMFKSHALDMKGRMTETAVVARREANISTAQTALVEPNGLYDQLLTSAKKVNFGDNKVLSQIDLALQGKVVADPDIQSYATTLMDARAELGTVLSRSGQLTDVARAQAEHALPIGSSFGEIKAAVAASRKASDAVMSGNTVVMDALKRGVPIEDAIKALDKSRPPTANAPKTFQTVEAAEAAAKAGKLKKGDKVVVNGQTGTWQ